MTDQLQLRSLRIMCLALGLAAWGLSPGCASLTSGLTTFRSAIDVADMVIDAIDDFATSYFTAHPDPSALAKIQAAEAQARTAAAAALSIANGVGDVQDAQVAQAFAAFEAAYSSLLALAQSIGVTTAAPGVRVGVESVPGGLVVPSPVSLRPAMVKEVTRSSVVGRSASQDSTKTRGVRPALPGADGNAVATASVDDPGDLLRGGPVVGQRPHKPPQASAILAPATRASSTLAGWPTLGSREAGSTPVSGAGAPGPTAGGDNHRLTLASCDVSCGKRLTSLVDPEQRGCLCYRENRRDERRSFWEHIGVPIEHAGEVAAR